jgi:7-cyano-7-deazaguanine synthase in queuosine biosynthesis
LDIFAKPSQATVAAGFDKLVAAVGQPSQPAVDFLLCSTAVFAADKKVLRHRAADRWTRSFDASLPVADPSCWERVTPLLTEALAFLTGDAWQLEWRTEPTTLWAKPSAVTSNADAVSLFSGGLDSLVGAIDLLEDRRHTRVVLLSHFDQNQLPRVQVELADRLSAYYGADRVHAVQVSVRPAGRRAEQQYPLPAGRESSTRSRSIMFLGLGIAAAAALGPDVPLYVPENGFIAINTPLSDARLGSCSTRTTHPYFLDRLRAFLSGIGISNPLINPYLLQSKGEMLANCRNATLLRELVESTISCARPDIGRYEQRGYGNCGYCLPCLIRRASLHAIGLDDSSRYLRDVCTDVGLFDGRSARGRDGRAVFAALHALRGDPLRRSMLAPALSGPLAGHRPTDIARVYRQGLAELEALFVAKASPAVRQIAGL